MAWIVKNLLRGTLTFRGMGLSIPPKGELDLDSRLGRDHAERSNQVLVAFEEGYLQTVKKDEPSGAGGTSGAAGPAALTESALTGHLDAIKTSLREDMGNLRASLAGDVRGMLDNLKVQRAKIHEEKERILVDRSLSDAEIRARLARLDDEERELEKNFTELGRKREAAAGGVSAAEKADLLSSM